MKNLILCCDGTWNTPDQEDEELPSPTNVVRIRHALAGHDAAGNEQNVYYHTGVGTEGNALQKMAGGMYGAGISRIIQSAYVWLAQHYRPGDRIYLFGFSRGAFTVRSLAAFVGECGILDLRECSPAEAYARADRAYEQGYRDNKPNWKDPAWPVAGQARETPVHFVGVWDTVGALGVPDDLSFLNLLDRPEKWRFHDTGLGAHITHARHAVAMDERRASFTPTLWTDGKGEPINDARCKQIWFAGVHSDVGGGYAETGLSNLALKWMIDEAAACGLAFRDQLDKQLAGDSSAPMHDSLRGVFKAMRSRPRSLPCPITQPAFFHDSVQQRRANPPLSEGDYRPCQRLSVGASVSLPVYARDHWNDLGVYLETGAEYVLSASGEWLDASVACGPAGTDDGKFSPGELAHLAGTLFGKVESAVKKITKNPNGDFWMTRRNENCPWFSLIGVIANDGRGQTATANDGSPTPHESFLIGTQKQLKVTEGGFFYAYANDAWTFYGNNKGKVMLTVKRLA